MMGSLTAMRMRRKEKTRKNTTTKKMKTKPHSSLRCLQLQPLLNSLGTNLAPNLLIKSRKRRFLLSKKQRLLISKLLQLL